jgi:formate dehydrogenase subunit gamma
MKKFIFPCTVLLLLAAVLAAAENQLFFTPLTSGSITTDWQGFNAAFTGDWQQYGEQFTSFQPALFNQMFLAILVLVPAVFLFHYLLIGAKKFDHTGYQVLFFPLFARLVHWLAALAFSVLVVTGLMVVFGKLFGGGSLVMTARYGHLVAAPLFAATALLMLLIWLKEMLPRPCDLVWLLIMGGYLSKKKKPVPAGKFNAGQKMWFWLVTLGGGVMAYTGWYLFTFQTSVDQLRIMAMIHNFLAAALLALFVTHLYMSLFAIKGSLQSMVTGYKPQEEVEILHSRYKIHG